MSLSLLQQVNSKQVCLLLVLAYLLFSSSKKSRDSKLSTKIIGRKECF